MDPKDGESFLLEHPCGYFEDGRAASSQYVAASGQTSERFSQYLSEGYRRVGSFFYRPQCPGCSLCMPMRIPIASFAPSRSQRRTIKANLDVKVELGEPRVTPEKLQLYASYLRLKHRRDPEPSADALNAELCTMHYGYPYAIEVRFMASGQLMGVSIVDAAEGALSANYFYYDTRMLARRPGILSLLMELDLCRAMGLKYHYLGYWVRGCRAMDYKAGFRPAEVLGPEGHWVPMVDKSHK